jgi:hypothetical protein
VTLSFVLYYSITSNIHFVAETVASTIGADTVTNGDGIPYGLSVSPCIMTAMRNLVQPAQAMQSCTGLLKNENFHPKAELLISACWGILPNPQMIENSVFGGALETLITAKSNIK